MYKKYSEIIDRAWEDRAMLKDPAVVLLIKKVIKFIDDGDLRIAEPKDDKWQVNEWAKKAVVMFFQIQKMENLLLLLKVQEVKF